MDNVTNRQNLFVVGSPPRRISLRPKRKRLSHIPFVSNKKKRVLVDQGSNNITPTLLFPTLEQGQFSGNFAKKDSERTATPQTYKDLDKKFSNAFDNSSFLGAILSPINPLPRSNSESHRQRSRQTGRMSNATKQEKVKCETTTKRLYSSKDALQRYQFNSPARVPRYCRIPRATSTISSSLLSSSASTLATTTAATPRPRAVTDVIKKTPSVEELEDHSLLLRSPPAMTAYRTPQRKNNNNNNLQAMAFGEALTAIRQLFANTDIMVSS